MRFPEGPSTLIIAHPGHELRISGWLSRAKPTVHVLTTGSRHGQSRQRLAASRDLIESLGGNIGEVFGWFEDRALYALLMAGDVHALDEILVRLMVSLTTSESRLVVCDAWQLYSPAHDLAHLLARTAVAATNLALGTERIRLLEFGVVPQEQSLFDGAARERHRLLLDEGELLKKMQHAARYPEFESETAEFLRLSELNALAIERFDAPLGWSQLKPSRGMVPLYEVFGEERVAAGHYAEVLRWKHMRPFVEAFRQRAAKTRGEVPMREPAMPKTPNAVVSRGAPRRDRRA